MPHYPKKFVVNPVLPEGYYNSVCLSASGRYQTIVQREQSDATCAQANLYVSCNFGKTFRKRLMNLNLTGVAMSSSGQFQTAVVQGNNTVSPPHLGFLYTSSDHGRTWAQNTSAPSNGWYGVAVSGNGQYQLALPNTYKSPPDNGFLYVSTDYGQTWSPRTGPGEQLWLNGAIDATGQIMAAVVFGTLTDPSTASAVVIPSSLGPTKRSSGNEEGGVLPGKVYLSKDFGQTWSPVPNLSDYFTCIAVSKDGQYLTAGAQNCFYAPAIPQPLYTSADGGTNWTIHNSNMDNWLSVAMSGDGQYQCALSYQQEPDSVLSGYVFQSFDFGVTWTKNASLPQSEWTSNAISKDGMVQTLVSTLCGNVYVQKGAPCCSL